MISALLGEEGGVSHWFLFFFETILILLLKWKHCYQIYSPKTIIKEIDLAIIEIAKAFMQAIISFKKMILVTIIQIFYHVIMIIFLTNVISILHLNVGFRSCIIP